VIESHWKEVLNLCLAQLKSFNQLTSEWINANLLANFQCFFDVALLDTLNAQVAEHHLHVFAVDFQRADAFLAAIAADNTMWMSSGKMENVRKSLIAAAKSSCQLTCAVNPL
jgi:hypothetical protein